MEEMIGAVINELQHQEPNRNISITIQKLENAKADKNLLKQVFINLLSNAFKYTGKRIDAKVEIGFFNNGSQQVYYVKDNGAGFDMRYYEKLFGVFQRLHSTSEFEGTGVGLAIIKRIISKHGGKVWAEAKVNEGACFYVALPNV